MKKSIWERCNTNILKKIINDAKESSGMQYDIKVLPIMVGSIGTGKEESIGKLISPFLSNRGIFTVISSDFCHCKSSVMHHCLIF